MIEAWALGFCLGNAVKYAVWGKSNSPSVVNIGTGAACGAGSGVSCRTPRRGRVSRESHRAD